MNAISENYRSQKLREALTNPPTEWQFRFIRFLIYGTILVTGEVAFYSLVRIGREIPLVSFLFQFEWRVDPRLHMDAVWSAPIHLFFGQASLYMFLVYGLAALFFCEPVFVRFHRWNYWARAVIYCAGILTIEWVAGFFLYKVTGYKIWYYTDRFAIFEFTSLSIAGFWLILPISLETIYPILISQQAKTRLAAELTAILDRDTETGLFNLGYWLRAVDAELSKSARHNTPFAVLRVAWPPESGDAAAISQTIAGQSRKEDLVCRTAVNEVRILMPHARASSIKVMSRRLKGLLRFDKIEFSGHLISNSKHRKALAAEIDSEQSSRKGTG